MTAHEQDLNELVAVLNGRLERRHVEAVEQAREIGDLRREVADRGEAVAKYQQACGDHQRRAFEATADRDRAREEAVALTDDLAEIKTLAYMGGQDAETVRRAILGVFERRSR